MSKVQQMVDSSKQGIAERLNIMFIETGVTLEEFGAVADKTKQAAAAWLKTGRASQESLKLLTKYYKYSIVWLLTGVGPKHVTDSMMVGVSSVNEMLSTLGDEYSKEQKGELAVLFAQLIRQHEDKQKERYAAASDKARSLADHILSMSASGMLNDDLLDAVAKVLNLRPVHTHENSAETAPEVKVSPEIRRIAEDMVAENERLSGLRLPDWEREGHIERVALQTAKMMDEQRHEGDQQQHAG